MGTSIATPATFTATCDKCGATATATGTPLPEGWTRATGPKGNAVLCPTDTATLAAFWADVSTRFNR